MKTTVIFHSADYDGLFCREIARKFLPGAELIGWDFPDKPLPVPDGQIYILDLPVDRVFGFNFQHCEEHLMKPPVDLSRIIWIDHHKSSIDTHPTEIPGYRFDGVAACRLAWQWFEVWGRYLHQTNPDMRDPQWFCSHYPFPKKEDFIDRMVSEPLAVRLAGEYDVWDHRGDGDLEFQFGLDCLPESYLQTMLGFDATAENTTSHAISLGKGAMACYAKRDADVMRTRSFMVEFEGLKFLALNTPRCNSNTFNSKDVPETGHDGLLAFYYNGREWIFSLYHAAHRKDIDLSVIARRLGGGGHKGACGFKSPFPPHAWRVL